MNEEHAVQCDCKYQFGQSVDTVIELLRRQRTTAWTVLGSAVLAVAGSLFLVVSGKLRAIWLVAGSFTWSARAIRKLLITRTSLRQLESRKLPEAKLLKD